VAKQPDGSAAKPIVISEKTDEEHLSLGRGIDFILQTTGRDGFGAISPLEKSIFDWHIANLEYGCATDLARVSLEHWDQVSSLARSATASLAYLDRGAPRNRTTSSNLGDRIAS
jgi:hypothetical protein